MKKLFYTIAASLLICVSATAAVPGSFKWQAVVRDGNGAVLADKEVSVNIRIHQGEADGTILYGETHTANCETYIANNTFYGGDGAFRLYFQNAPVYFVNNFAYVDRATILSEYTTDANLGQIHAYNNILYGGERGVNENILEPGLTTEAAACNNTIGLTSQATMVALGVNTKLTTDDPDSKVPYLPILRQNSVLVDAGLDSYAEIDGEVENFIPATDVRGKASNGKKDIGAFEYNGLNAGVETITTGENINIAFISNGSEIVVTNSNGDAMDVAVYSVDGKLLYNARGENVTISKDNLAKGIVIVKATDNNGSATKKMVVM